MCSIMNYNFKHMKLNLTEIERVKTISKEDFYNNYVKKHKPLVVEQLTLDWPAYSKWKLEYIKEIAGNDIVPSLSSCA